jgi:AbrB family looped-hinge helix DNA binding protein
MTTGIVRKIDDLGRIVIPAEMRRVLGIEEGDELEITLSGDHVEIRPRIPTIVHEFTLADAESIQIDDLTIDLEAGEYVVKRLRRSRA